MMVLRIQRHCLFSIPTFARKGGGRGRRVSRPVLEDRMGESFCSDKCDVL